jgi:hypothetical protein
MTNLSNLTTSQFREIVAIKEQIEALQGQIDSIAGGGGSFAARKPGGRRKMSRSEAARIAVTARWAKVRAAKAETAPKKRRISAAHRRKLMKALAKARKMRWARKKDWRSSPAVRAKLREIEASKQELPVLVLSSAPEELMAPRVLRAGAGRLSQQTGRAGGVGSGGEEGCRRRDVRQREGG